MKSTLKDIMKKKNIIFDEKNLIRKYQKKVYSIYPKAFVKRIGRNFTIVQEQDDLSIKDILAEMLILPQPTQVKAWEMAQISAKTTQNFNRTHPQRMDVSSHDEKKMSRIESRKNRGGLGESKKCKRNKLDSYYIYD